jgi:transcriptional regulator with XRE-family HTH domain
MKHYYNEAEKKAFAAKINALLDQKNMSQSDLARAIWGTDKNKTAKTGYVVQYGRDRISNYCRGEAIPTARALKELSVALNVAPNDLLHGGGYGPTRQPTKEAPVNDINLSVVAGAPEMLRLQLDVLLPAAIAAQLASVVTANT